MRYLSNLSTVVFVLAIPVLLVTGNIRYLLGDVSFYERGLRKYDAVETTGISLEELDRASAEIVRYFEDDAKTLRVIVVQDGEEVSLFNQRETTHMEDVKRLVRFMFRLNEVALGFIIIYIAAVVLWSRERSLRRLAVETLAAVAVAFAVLIGVGIFFVLGFDAAWDQAHEIVFPNDLWRLNPRTDHLIQMFPEKFWEEATFIAGGLALAEAALLVILASAYLGVARPGKPAIELATEEAPALLLEDSGTTAEDAEDDLAAGDVTDSGGDEPNPSGGADDAAVEEVETRENRR